jgi:hypothetical protein
MRVSSTPNSAINDLGQFSSHVFIAIEVAPYRLELPRVVMEVGSPVQEEIKGDSGSTEAKRNKTEQQQCRKEMFDEHA